MPDKLDYKKEYKDLYMPKQKAVLVEVPSMNFIMVDGIGAPTGEQYQRALQALYALSFTIKMSKMGGKAPDGYFEYVVPPLEGLWWSEGGRLQWDKPKSEWLWTSMIRQPEFVTEEVFAWAVDECRVKKSEVDISRARFAVFKEGLCVQIMHIGGYDDELRSMELMDQFILDNELTDISGDVHKHHEIYLNNPQKTVKEKLKTVLRTPVE